MRVFIAGQRLRKGPLAARRDGAIRVGSIITAIIGLIIPTVPGHAASYRPASPISILSEYAALNSTAPPHTQVWKVTAETSSEGAAIVRFFPEAAAGSDAVCVVGLPASGSSGEIRWKGIGTEGEKRSATGLLLAPGFPVPCDIIPVGQPFDGRVYQEQSQAGGRIFTRTYRLSASAPTAGEATSKGWIRGEEPGNLGLIMITVSDERGQPVLRQLWPVGGDWWLYEETPRRRSWLIH